MQTVYGHADGPSVVHTCTQTGHVTAFSTPPFIQSPCILISNAWPMLGPQDDSTAGLIWLKALLAQHRPCWGSQIGSVLPTVLCHVHDLTRTHRGCKEASLEGVLSPAECAGNLLTGAIMANWLTPGGWPALYNLTLNDNALTGSLPSQLGLPNVLPSLVRCKLRWP